MRFNLEAGAVKAKQIFGMLDKYMEAHIKSKGEKPSSLVLYRKDYNTLRHRAEKALIKAESKDTTPVDLYYLGVPLSSD